MQIHGIEGLTPERLREELRAGGRFVIFSYCISVILLTFRRSTDIYFVRADESAAAKSMPWTLISLVFGWWGFPFGLVFTPIAIIQNLGGGKDVTQEVASALNLEPVPPPTTLAGAPGQPGSQPPTSTGLGDVPAPFGQSPASTGAPGAVSGEAPSGWTPGVVSGGEAPAGWTPGVVSGGEAPLGRAPGLTSAQPGGLSSPSSVPSGATGWVGGAGGPVSSAQGWAQPRAGVRQSDPVNSQAGWSLALGALSLACCAPLGWIGAVLGILSVKRAREEGRPAPGLAVGGIALSALSTLVTLGLVAVVAEDVRERNAKRAALLAKAAPARQQAALTKAAACQLVEAALLDGLYGEATSFTGVTCDGELNDHPGGAELDVVRARWDDKDETLTACFAKSTRWYLLSVGPGVACPEEAPVASVGPAATDAELTEEEERLQRAAKDAPTPSALRAGKGTQFQAPLGDADFPELKLDIVAVHRKQKPTASPPFHAAGGDWTYFDVAVTGQPGARVVVGASDTERTGGFVAFGDVVLAAPDREAGSQFLEAYAKAFHVEAPPAALPATSLEPLTFRAVVLGTGLAPASGGGFGDEPGTWTATKWFPAHEGIEAEIFFNYDLEGRKAELSQKDESYDQDLAELFAAALRDGPRPPRTTKNDPTLASSGPVLQGFKLVSDSRLRTWLEGDRLLYIREDKSGETLLQLDLASGATTELCSVEHQIDHVEQSGPRALVAEVMPEDEHSIASTDPTRIVLCEKGRGAVLEFEAAAPRYELLTMSLSPDGRFVAVGRWEADSSGQGQHRSIVLRDREQRTETVIQSGDESWDVVGWRLDKAEPIAELEKGFPFDPPEERAAADYSLVTHKQTASNRALHVERDVKRVSPDGKLEFSVERGKALTVTEVKSGRQRRLELHPADRRFTDDGSFGWIDNRYLRFDAARPALVDTRDMKVWFPLPPADTSTLRYTPDFRHVVRMNDEGTFVGKVTVPK